MTLQLGLSFGNGPFIVHKVARLHRRVLDHQPGSSSVTSLISCGDFAPFAKFSQTAD